MHRHTDGRMQPQILFAPPYLLVRQHGTHYAWYRKLGIVQEPKNCIKNKQSLLLDHAELLCTRNHSCLARYPAVEASSSYILVPGRNTCQNKNNLHPSGRLPKQLRSLLQCQTPFYDAMENIHPTRIIYLPHTSHRTACQKGIFSCPSPPPVLHQDA